MHLQQDRPPNLAQAHDARFENINKDPVIFSKTKKQTTIEFDKKPPRDTASTLIRKDTIGPNNYTLNDSTIKKRSDFSFVDIAKQSSPKQAEAIDFTHDELKASQQFLGSTSGKTSSLGGINGPISMSKQPKRQFAHFDQAERSEQQERAIEEAKTEAHQQRMKQVRQANIMNIHSRLNNKTGSPSRASSQQTGAKQYRLRSLSKK